MAREQLQKVGEDGRLVCITCGLGCESVAVSMKSAGGKYFVVSCFNGLEKVPRVSIYEMGQSEGQGVKEVVVLEENEKLRKQLEWVELPRVRAMNFSHAGYEMRVKLWLPWDFDEGKEYPVLIDVYGE
jgi:dipeptidyl aminopeptidase/acylaminoacyl peptidase